MFRSLRRTHQPLTMNPPGTRAIRAIIEKVIWESFLEHKVFVGMSIRLVSTGFVILLTNECILVDRSLLPPDFSKFMSSQGQGQAGYEYPSDERLQVSDVVNDREIQQPCPSPS